MKDRKKRSASRPEDATPFFARYLEGQTEEDAEAKVTERGGRANVVFAKKATKKSAKKSAKKSGKKSSGARAAAAPAMTLKYPSDRDEYVYFPYHPEAATAGPGSRMQTLKYPSDNDEGDALYAVYANESDVPKTAKAKPKKDAAVRLTTRAPKAK
ncbi:MAG TPA: microviridin/marinostatin family tricyclic proteinase inhibitor [Pyrinomonadaceae bacterium]|nr:microviridin/marinostatin family tricyclic proteinase inhibitor [Pyrinomonadaceae bacterium]